MGGEDGLTSHSILIVGRVENNKWTPKNDEAVIWESVMGVGKWIGQPLLARRVLPGTPCPLRVGHRL
jgi:hypothetical protein